MAEHQGPRRHAACKIVVHGLAGRAGEDVTSKLHPYLISVQIIDSLEGGHDECHIELDDRNAELQLPPDKVTLQVSLGWAGEGPRIPNRGRSSIVGDIAEVTEPFTLAFAKGEMPFGGPGMESLFNGWVSEVESGFGRRSGGRRVWITGTSGNVMGLAKGTDVQTMGEGKPVDESAGSGGQSGGGAGGGAAGGSGPAGVGGAGEIPLNDFMQKVFKDSGISVKLSPEMMKVKRDFWSMNGSPMDFARDVATKVGGVMKIAGNVVTIIGKGEGVNADGIAMPTVDAVWGINLIGWRIKPYSGRAQWKKAESRHFNLNDAEWLKASMNVGGDGPFGRAEAAIMQVAAQTGPTEAGQTNEGAKKDSTSRRGTGWILLNGEPRAKAGGWIHISRARPGVDGKYLMTEVEHNYTRGVGYTTRCNVQYPTPDYGPGLWYGKTEEVPKPKEVPPVPLLTPQMRFLPEEEKEELRKWYIERGEEIPDVLLPGAQLLPPSNPNELSMTPEELERARATAEAMMQESMDRILDSMKPIEKVPPPELPRNFGNILVNPDAPSGPAVPLNRAVPERSWTPQELQRPESYVPGQAGEGGITFPE